jgi:hypothetical protein
MNFSMAVTIGKKMASLPLDSHVDFSRYSWTQRTAKISPSHLLTGILTMDINFVGEK